jgi:cytoplasmic iron level regulating protein YaaA (DUF328/UPF0246 family)
MKHSKTRYLEDKSVFFKKEHIQILKLLKSLSKNDIENAYKVKGSILDNTYSNIRNYDNNPSYQAFPSFTGLVFLTLNRDIYTQDEYDYISRNIRILDAFYGILEPGTLIKPYRLDMKVNIGVNLYNHWKIDDYFKNEIVINLASNEYSKMLNIPMINISFLQFKNGKYINQATYSKQARGLFLDYIILNKIENVELMKNFNRDNYQYNKNLSDESNMVFTR